MIRKLDKAEFQQATTLALEVYLQCGQDDFCLLYTSPSPRDTR